MPTGSHGGRNPAGTEPGPRSTAPGAETRPRPKAPGWQVDLALATVVCLWALNFVLLKAVLPRFDPLALAAVRFAAIACLFECLLRARGGAPRVEPGDRLAFGVSAVFGYTVYQGLFILGLSRSSAFSTALMINTGPAWAALILSLFRLERVGGRQWLGIAVALAGLVLYVGPRLGPDRTAGVGDVLALGAALSWTVYGVLNRPLLERYGAFHVTTRTFQAGALLFLPAAVPAVLRQPWDAIGPAGWAAVGYSVVFPITVAVSLWNWAIGQQGVARTVVYQYLVPVAAGLLSFALLGERFGPGKIVGASVILAGVALSRRR